MMRKFLGTQYPLVKTPRGLLAQKQGVDEIKANMYQLLLTEPGERVMLPEFGTPLRRLLFEQNTTLLEMEAKQVIAKAVKRWEPRIIVENIHVSTRFDPADLNAEDTQENIDHILGIRIDFFDPQDIQKVEALELKIPLGGR